MAGAVLITKLRRFLRSSLFINGAFGAVLLVLLIVGVYYGCVIISEQRQEYRVKLAQLEECERDVAQVQAEVDILEKKKARLQQADGVKDAAREKLGMVNKGEVAYVVKGMPDNEAASSRNKVSAGTYEPGRRPSGFFFTFFGPLIF
mgnify:FL=1